MKLSEVFLKLMKVIYFSFVFLGFLYKPITFRTLRDVLHHQENKLNERISVLCKLMYCRLNESPTGIGRLQNSFELFLTDDSAQRSVTDLGELTTGESLSYVKVVGKSQHVFPQELREALISNGTVLSLQDLLFRTQGYCLSERRMLFG